MENNVDPGIVLTTTNEPLQTQQNEFSNDILDRVFEDQHQEGLKNKALGLLSSINENLLFLSIYLVGIACMFQKFIQPGPLLLLMGIIDLVLLIKRLTRIKKKITYDQSFCKMLCFGVSQPGVIDSIARVLSEITFTFLESLSNNKSSYAIIPLFLALLIVLISYISICCKVDVHESEESEQEIFGKYISFIARLLFVIQIFIILLKYNNKVSASWESVFWPFWIFFSLAVIFGIAVLLLTLTQVIGYLCNRDQNRKADTISICWVFYLVDGITVFSFLLVYFIRRWILMISTTGTLCFVIGLFVMYNLFGVVLSFSARKSIVAFFINITVEELEGIRTTGGRGRMNQIVPLPFTSQVEVQNIDQDAERRNRVSQLTESEREIYEERRRKKLEKELNIPDFLYKFSETFYKRVTDKKEKRLRKIFSKKKQKKYPDEKLAAYISESQSKVGEIEDNISVKVFDISVDKDPSSNSKHDQDEENKPQLPQSKLKDKKGGKNSKITKSKSSVSLKKKKDHDAEKTEIPKKFSEEKTKKKNDEDWLCQVCYTNKADSVNMNCGHGGICYECATGMWKNNEECYLCRKKILYVIQLEVETAVAQKYLRVLASTVIVEDSESVESEFLNEINQTPIQEENSSNEQGILSHPTLPSNMFIPVENHQIDQFTSNSEQEEHLNFQRAEGNSNINQDQNNIIIPQTHPPDPNFGIIRSNIHQITPSSSDQLDSHLRSHIQKMNENDYEEEKAEAQSESMIMPCRPNWEFLRTDSLSEPNRWKVQISSSSQSHFPDTGGDSVLKDGQSSKPYSPDSGSLNYADIQLPSPSLTPR